MSLGDVVREVQNPVLGSALLWRFVVGFTAGTESDTECPLQFTFLVLPLLYNKETATQIYSTQRLSGLAKFAEKFTARQSDVLLGLHDSVREHRLLTTDALQIAVTSQLLQVRLETGAVVALSVGKVKTPLSKGVQELLRSAEKLGFWFSRLGMHDVAAILKVRF